MDSDLKSVAIIGAGQLGGRHLQGVLGYEVQVAVYVFDISDGSLDIAKQRAGEIQHSHSVTFTKEWQTLPNALDLVIVATSANVREEVIFKLVQSCDVKYLILEKVLFQSLSSYARIASLLEARNISAWVNHPRRMLRDYQDIYTHLNTASGGRIYTAAGGNWGLGCNALHFIDLFTYFDRSLLAQIDFRGVDQEILPSKRDGFVEFTGTIVGTFESGNTFMISSFPGMSTGLTILVAATDSRWVIQESGTPQVVQLSGTSNFSSVSKPFLIEFQSALTKRLISGIFETGACELPSYNTASRTHLPFVSGMIEKYNELTGKRVDFCPIT
jgi:hypothetical protein